MTEESYDIGFLRPEIKLFAIDMEREMRKKDKLGYENKIMAIDYLEKKLHNERNEADDCFIDNNIDKFINKESLHEGIMLALLRHRLKEEQIKN